MALQERFDDWNNEVYIVDNITGMGVILEDGTDYSVETDENGEVVEVEVEGVPIPEFCFTLGELLEEIHFRLQDIKNESQNWYKKHNKELEEAQRDYDNGNYYAHEKINYLSKQWFDWYNDGFSFTLFKADGTKIQETDIDDETLKINSYYSDKHNKRIFKNSAFNMKDIVAVYMNNDGYQYVAYNDKGKKYMSEYMGLTFI